MRNLLTDLRALQGWLGLGVIGLLLTGCSLPIKPPETQSTYRLNAPALQTPAITQPGNPNPQVFLLQMRPMSAAQGFESSAMMYSREALVLSPYRDSRWLAAPAALLTDAIEQALSRQPWVSGVVGNSANAPVVLKLSCDLTRLEHDLTDSTGHAHLVMSCLWLNPVTRTVQAHWRFDQIEAVPKNDAAQFAVASQALVDRALAEIVAKTRTLLVESVAEPRRSN